MKIHQIPNNSQASVILPQPLPQNNCRVTQLSTKHTIYFSLFIAAISLTLLLTIRLAPPQRLILFTNSDVFDTSKCPNPIGFMVDQLYCQQFSSQDPSLGLVLSDNSVLSYINYLILQLSPSESNKHENQQTNSINQNVIVTVYKIDRIETPTGIKFTKAQQLHNSTQILSHKDYDQSHQDHQSEQDQREKGYDSQPFQITLNQFAFSSGPSLFIKLSFTNYQQLVPYLPLKLKSQSLNPAYMIYSIVLRYFLFILSLSVTIYYLINFIRLKLKQEPSIQQLYILFCLLFLLFATNPFISLYLTPGKLIVHIIYLIFLSIFFLKLICLFIFASFNSPKFNCDFKNQHDKCACCYNFVLIISFSISISICIFTDFQILPVDDLYQYHPKLQTMKKKTGIILSTVCLVFWIAISMLRIIYDACVMEGNILDTANNRFEILSLFPKSLTIYTLIESIFRSSLQINQLTSEWYLVAITCYMYFLVFLYIPLEQEEQEKICQKIQEQTANLNIQQKSLQNRGQNNRGYQNQSVNQLNDKQTKIGDNQGNFIDKMEDFSQIMSVSDNNTQLFK